MINREEIFYDGFTWYRYPGSKQRQRAEYFFRQEGKALSSKKYDVKKVIISLHHYVWEKYNGPRPKGYDIHHRDGNKRNNDISNLECITHSEHATLTNLNRFDEKEVICSHCKKKYLTRSKPKYCSRKCCHSAGIKRQKERDRNKG